MDLAGLNLGMMKGGAMGYIKAFIRVGQVLILLFNSHIFY
jgi:hypothetical protein